MKIIRKKDQKEIESTTCGNLLEVVNHKDVPISISISENIKPTKGHYHKELTEFYWVLEGKIKVNVVKNGQSKVHTIESGDLLILERDEYHEIVEASKANKVAVMCYPRWSAEDMVVTEK